MICGRAVHRVFQHKAMHDNVFQDESISNNLPGRDDNNVVNMNTGTLRTGKERNLDPAYHCLMEENTRLCHKLARQKTEIKQMKEENVKLNGLVGI